jgi:uncharacterized membrane protein YbjE (DUF340 family)
VTAFRCSDLGRGGIGRPSELTLIGAGSIRMVSQRQQAVKEFRQILRWIVLIAVLMVAGALTYLYQFSSLDVSTVIAVTFGVFFSVLLGCGLFAAAFFSDKSGMDQDVTDVTRSERDKH